MAARISITTSKDAQLKAAGALSQALRTLGCPHAYIGGFAWALLGSTRATLDIDVLVEIKDTNLLELRQKLSEFSKQFASSADLKFYFVQEIRGDLSGLSGDELVRASKDNVMIETLQTGTLGLPTVAGPVYDYLDESGAVLSVLHPGVLILTKIKRWARSCDSTRPQTAQKNASDARDLRWLVHWLADHETTIDFDGYAGKTKEELLQFVRLYRSKLAEDTLFCDTLSRAIKPNDWDLL
ncbi:hypothetical protein C8R46DRAFT_985749, partial [Mycena filopes]